MSLLTDLYSRLTEDVALSILIDDRVYPMRLPDTGSMPCVTYWLISNDHGHNLDSAAGHTLARVQVDTWAETLGKTEQVSEAIRESLQGFNGTMGSTDCVILLDGEQDQAEAPQDGSDVWIYHRSQDFLILHSESIPTF